MTAPARVAAFHALATVSAGAADLPAALVRARGTLTDDRDQALTGEIVTGALRWQRALDHLIAWAAKRPLEALDPEVLVILRLSLYQVLHLDRVPVSAIVNDAVDLTRMARKTSAAGFVNGVLRTVLRQRRTLPLPPRPTAGASRADVLAYLGVSQSHPDWLVARWLDRHGFEAAERWVRFDNETPRLTLRANALVAPREAAARELAHAGVDTEPTRYAPHGLVVTGGNPLRSASDTSFVVQDEASQLVTLAVGARPGERILDLCASPGGKTTAMAADMDDAGLLVSCDIRTRRVTLLRDGIRAAGVRHAHVVHVGSEGPLPFPRVFDRVLVDAPCSGVGTIRRDPDIRWRRRPEDLPALAAAQRRLLARAAQLVVPGGRLVYATCSSEPEENEDVVDAFLAGHDARIHDLRVDAPAPLAPVLDARGMLRTLPFEHGLEAFFAAAITCG